MGLKKHISDLLLLVKDSSSGSKLSRISQTSPGSECHRVQNVSFDTCFSYCCNFLMDVEKTESVDMTEGSILQVLISIKFNPPLLRS